MAEPAKREFIAVDKDPYIVTIPERGFQVYSEFAKYKAKYLSSATNHYENAFSGENAEGDRTQEVVNIGKVKSFILL